jgi:hypothetical protein
MVVDGFSAMSLITIDISNNNLTGVIPEVFWCLENLASLSLDNNTLTGTLPPELGMHSRGLYWISDDNCDAPGFQLRIIDTNDLANLVKRVDLVKSGSTWVITSKS